MAAVVSHNFRVRLAIPHFNDFDAIVGYSYETLALTMTKGWAFAIRDRNDSDGMDETYVEVLDRDGHRIFRDPPMDAPETQECPF